eukprot:CAMPEP_0196722748 /NCGR_PEP_ID=MMETSP1091-20130531/5018_1 /TAXON_ID=302021 /ORGANISM="Rhodomonas sp., Strain CCMP768" /LENGTH=220 /DNA_ID=CAMNT_0042064515 /DNA_START=198 /DNA_END=861 /DNA_ORIENTATION=+
MRNSLGPRQNPFAKGKVVPSSGESSQSTAHLQALLSLDLGEIPRRLLLERRRLASPAEDITDTDADAEHDDDHHQLGGISTPDLLDHLATLVQAMPDEIESSHVMCASPTHLRSVDKLIVTRRVLPMRFKPRSELHSCPRPSSSADNTSSSHTDSELSTVSAAEFEMLPDTNRQRTDSWQPRSDTVTFCAHCRFHHQSNWLLHSQIPGKLFAAAGQMHST